MPFQGIFWLLNDDPPTSPDDDAKAEEEGGSGGVSLLCQYLVTLALSAMGCTIWGETDQLTLFCQYLVTLALSPMGGTFCLKDELSGVFFVGLFGLWKSKF